MVRTLFMAIALVALAFTSVSAQSSGIGPQMGYFKTSDADQGNFTGGAVIRMPLSPALSLEGSINYRQEEFLDEQVTVKNWPLMVTGLFYPLPIVYGAAGAGWYNTTIDYDQDLLGINAPEDETKQKFGWHFGGGVELPFGTGSTLFGDIRYVFIDYNFDEIPGSSEISSDFVVMQLGLVFNM